MTMKWNDEVKDRYRVWWLGRRLDGDVDDERWTHKERLLSMSSLHPPRSHASAMQHTQHNSATCDYQFTTLCFLLL